MPIKESDFSSLLNDLSVINDLMSGISSADAFVNFLPEWLKLRTMINKLRIDIICLKELRDY